MSSRFWVVLLCWGMPSALLSQAPELELSQLLENYFQDQETLDPEAVQWLPDYLEYLLTHPLDLNKADDQSLQSLGLLGTLQIERLLEYRSRLGPLLSLYELQAIPDWTLEQISTIRPFVQVGHQNLDQRAQPLWKGLYQGSNELLYRVQRPRTAVAPSAYEGGPLGIGLRYQHRFDGRLRIGVTAEKDPGEALFRKSNPKGFDFYSAHFFWEEKKHPLLHKLAIGDFNVQLGQGLLIQSGFHPGKSAESVQILRSAKGLQPYNGFGEALFLRGMATQLRLKRQMELLVFISSRKKDAVVDTLDNSDSEELIFTSLSTTGLHRSPTEIAAECKVRESSSGISLGKPFPNGQISLNSVYTWLDTRRNPTPQPYRLYQFRGNRLLNSSLDYTFRQKNLLVFGENAVSQNGGWALTNGMVLGLDRRVSLAVHLRALTPTYQTLYGAAFAEGTGASNEQGGYVGLELRPSRSIRINGFLDLWRHPWLRYRVSAPSRGSEYLLRCSWQPNRQLNLYLLAQSRSKMQNASYPLEGLLTTERQRLRFHLQYKIRPGLEYRCRLEWMQLDTENIPTGTGFLGYQELVVKPRNRSVSGTLRYTLFDTDSYDSRVYAFENALFSAISIPALAGRGSRFYANIRWKAGRSWRLEARVEASYLDRSVSPGALLGFHPLAQLQGQLFW